MTVHCAKWITHNSAAAAQKCSRRVGGLAVVCGLCVGLAEDTLNAVAEKVAWLMRAVRD